MCHFLTIHVEIYLWPCGFRNIIFTWLNAAVFITLLQKINEVTLITIYSMLNNDVKVHNCKIDYGTAQMWLPFTFSVGNKYFLLTHPSIHHEYEN